MRMRSEHEPIEILLIEDNPGDVGLVLEGFKESLIAHRISVVDDGEEALVYLRTEQHPCPDFVLLDLNLPKKDGREVLSEMKADPKLRHLPVIIFSSSEAEQDLLHAYQLQASCFVTKAVDLEQFLTSVKSIADFWLASVKLPPRAWG
jgi:two-component system, chemotaxis family, response regulator Rcp1